MDSRQLRAVLGTAMTWAAAWAVAGGTIAGVLGLFDPNPGIESLPERLGMAIFAGVAWGIRFGIAGGVIGTVFSAAVRFTYMGRRLRDINPAKFALLGGIVGGVGVPLYLQLMNVLSGGPIPPPTRRLPATDTPVNDERARSPRHRPRPPHLRRADAGGARRVERAPRGTDRRRDRGRARVSAT